MASTDRAAPPAPGAEEAEEIVHMPITDELDLHTFSPRDVGHLVPEWIDEAWALGFRTLRVIHGKGTGQLRERVASILRKHPRVASFRPGGAGEGGWGATVLTLKG